MPNDSGVWIVLLVVAALVIGLALWLGRGLKIRKDKAGFSLETNEPPSAPTGSQSISVARDLTFDHATAGDIAGIKSADVDAVPEAKQNIDVLSGGKLTHARVGDIVGIKQERQPSQDKA